MKILVIDNYDSFTFNLVQLLGKLGCEIIVRRNNCINEYEMAALAPDRILVSPGPGRPEGSMSSLTAIQKYGRTIPVLGVCLGHQAIGISFGARVVKAPLLMHGKTSRIRHDGKTIYADVPQNFAATRYHSLIIDKDTLPDELEISAYSEDGIIMGVRHKQYPVEGIQYHPESVLTECGEKILSNWIK